MPVCSTQVNIATVSVNVQCCHVGYEYNNATGQCIFKYSVRNNVILRQDSIKHIYIYVQVKHYSAFIIYDVYVYTH